MDVRRGGIRLVMVLALLAGMVSVGAAPAAADDDRVGLRVPNSFTAGGSAGSVTVTVAKRTKGCVLVQTVLGLRLPGLTPERVRIEVSSGGQWLPIGVSGAGDGQIVTGPQRPDRQVLCDKKSVAVRYRVAFLAGAPAGTASFLGEAAAADGRSLGRRADTARVVGRRAVSRSPSPTPSPRASRSARPTPEPTEAVDTPPPSSAAGAAAPVERSGDGGLFGIGRAAMVLGIGMVGIGIALLVLLLRRSRFDGYEPPDEGGGDAPTVVMPRLPG